MIKIEFLIVLLILIVSLNLNAQQLSNDFHVNSQEIAYDKAIQFTGLNKKQAPLKALSNSKMIILDSLESENLPFLNKKFNGKEVWNVTLPNISLNSSGWDESYKSDQIVKTYIVSIDAKTGSLIKITAQHDTTKSFFYDKKSSASAEQALLGSGEEYTGVSTEPPLITMLDALEAAVPSNPLMAEEIHIVCVMQSYLGKEPRLVWCIAANNIPNNSNLGTYVRSVIDAETGKILYFANYP